MQKTQIDFSEIKLVGISARTNNANEMDPETGIIGPTIQRYLQQQIAETIPHRKNPFVTLAAYTEYASDASGDYTYFIGEEVTSFDGAAEGLKCITVPAQTFMKFTTAPGVMPAVVINAWQHIWNLNSDELGGERSFIADVEIYDQRSLDQQNAVVDVCIGISSV